VIDYEDEEEYAKIDKKAGKVGKVGKVGKARRAGTADEAVRMVGKRAPGRPKGSRTGSAPLCLPISGYLLRRETRTTPCLAPFMDLYVNHGYKYIRARYDIGEIAMRRKATYCIDAWEEKNGACDSNYRNWAHLRFRSHCLLEQSDDQRVMLAAQGHVDVVHRGTDEVRADFEAFTE
jgi:hypothetical protein